MSRKQKKYHFIYKTTCKITGKFYIGMHSADLLDDGYLGSGKILGYSRAKYGDENHTREILEHCESREQLKSREKEIVNEDMLKDPLNMNLKYGGEGGGRIWNAEHAKKFHKAGWEAMQAKIDKSKRSINAGKTFKKRLKDGELIRLPTFLGKKHSIKTLEKISKSRKGKCAGKQHPNFGKKNFCVNKNGVIKRISINLLESFLNDGWKRGIKNL